MRGFVSPYLPCPACEHVCGVLGPLSRNITLGGHLRVPHSGLTRLILPAAPHPLCRAPTHPSPPRPPLSAPRRPGRVQSSTNASSPNSCARHAQRGCGRRAWAGTELLRRSGGRPACRPARLLALGELRDCPARLLQLGLETPAPFRAQKIDSSPNSPGSWSSEPGALLGDPPHPSPARALGVTQLAPPPPPTPGRQRAWAQSPPGRRRPGEAAACAVERAEGARRGDGPRDAPDSHLLLLLPPLPARLPVARDHLRYVLE